MRKLRAGPTDSHCNPDQGQGIDEPPLFYEAEMQAAVRHLQHPFRQERNEAVAQRCNSNGSEVANPECTPESPSAVNPEHGGRNHCAQEDVQWMKYPEKL